VIHIFSQRSIFRSGQDNSQLNRQYVLDSKLREMEYQLLAMESNTQYYILTEQSKFFREIDRNMLQAQRHFDELERLLAEEDQLSKQEFLNLKQSFNQKIDFNNALLDSFRMSGREVAQRMIKGEEVALLNQNLLTHIRDFSQAQGLQQRDDGHTGPNKHSQSLLIDNLAYLLAVGILIFAVLYLLLSLRKRMKLEESLLQAKEEVERSARVKEQFLANMSHEIRTPLQAILGYTTLLGKEQLNDKCRQYVDGIRIAGENLLNIVNDILDVSKIEAGMLRLERVPFSISGLMHSVDNMFRSKVAEKGIYLKLHPNPHLPDLLIGDPTRLTQILVNLINNAVKFTDEGGIDIYLKGVREAPGQLRLTVTVQDSGIGIPPDKLSRIFERFEQADSRVTRIYGGSGLGLHIVKQLVQLQGGDIQAESEVGKGSIFSFNIPYQIAQEQAADKRKGSGLVDLQANFENIRVLLVEDNLMNQRVVGTFLSEWGIEYDLAENGKIAIKQLEKQPYDLILMDVQMPEMDGYSATEYIRQNMGLRTPIVAMTAHAFAGEREKALGYGMNEYISKPIREEDLYNIIARFVPLKRGGNGPIPKPQLNMAAAAPASSPNGISVDYNYLMQTSKGKKSYLRSILELFLQQAPKELAAMEAAMADGHIEEVGKIAHSLKSTAGYAGLDHHFRPLLERIEQSTQQQPLEHSSLQQLLEQLKSLMEQALENIRTEAMKLVEEEE